MQVCDEVQTIVELVHSLTNNDIVLKPDPGLNDICSEGYFPGEGVFTISYNPKYADELDFFIAHQCGRLLRFRLAPPKDRKVPCASWEDRERAFKALGPEIARLHSKDLPDYALTDCFEYNYTNILNQLFATPANARIEKWINTSFTGLREIQQKSTKRRIGQSAPSLSADVERYTPPRIYQAYHAMSYAYSRFLHQYVCQEPLLSLYKNTPHEKLGNRLLEYLNEKDQGHISDVKTSDSWANILGMRGWFHWRDYEEVARYKMNKRNNQQED
jgi:hypothetical protein